MSRHHSFRAIIGVLVLVLSISLPACGGSSDSGGGGGGGSKSSLDGQGCTKVASYMCAEEIVHLCRFQNNRMYWEAKIDCKGSTTPGCKCTLIQEFGTCSTDGTINGACTGKTL